MASVDSPAIASPFDSLPVELLDNILSRLSLQGLFSGRDVCSLWRKVIANNPAMQNRLFLTPQSSRYHARYAIFGDPEDRCRIELRLFRRRTGNPAPSSFIRYTDTFAIRVFPIGHMNEVFFDSAYEGRVPDSGSPFSMGFSRDPRQNDDLYMGAYQSILVAQPPQTSMQFVMAVRDAQLRPEDSPTRQRLVAKDDEYATHTLDGFLETGIMRRVEVENQDGIRVGDVIREINQAETETGGHFDWKISDMEFPDLKCLSSEDLRHVLYAHPPGSVDDLVALRAVTRLEENS